MTQPLETILAPHPFGTEITEQQLIEHFQQCKLWEERYRQLIGLTKKLPNLPDELKQQNIEISGCENRVWLGHQRLSDGCLHFYGDSEGRIVKGLLAVILTAVEGKTPEQVLQAPLTELFQQLGLEQQLSGSRLNGVKSLINTIQEIARSYIE
ncbi:cysteine desulfurase sulfur acceptor subunit CsdE [Xenorhabdus sp. 42]|uniref:cysteine desulfurase sulfur acceptor subunit CsdE n=1 Tax=Xenorhabdus szentirmaii TaxID=290112 RepID=UPI0019988027|nr:MULTISPECIES: cysteine desulfurase sulfur acceptor subunit CsdE [unclassified Xenorhabdus]MBD2781565.1 cysteine desulfurase sulfur acceptor subunit CsdE [Xenorhabdus sp. 38]MBD2793570.1 cysteine desulfurase sulfur acceptor subunit CsdE [Xenorhabdus sp. CUL]MBD2820452.1 cysteine desulfurase sulfur acceptor subunit CsdE [Xenorhabdus sp. 42]MBD2824747.1 cysteine desulfurase sulfur acceptor subunit CsdE [Xenorhabdus sp. 5]